MTRDPLFRTFVGLILGVYFGRIVTMNNLPREVTRRIYDFNDDLCIQLNPQGFNFLTTEVNAGSKTYYFYLSKDYEKYFKMINQSDKVQKFTFTNLHLPYGEEQKPAYAEHVFELGPRDFQKLDVQGMIFSIRIITE